ncbi:hypothetical protein ACRAWD_25205 [Caulobacter segnis]
MDEYTAGVLAAKRAEGLSGAAWDKLVAETMAMKRPATPIRCTGCR